MSGKWIAFIVVGLVLFLTPYVMGAMMGVFELVTGMGLWVVWAVIGLLMLRRHRAKKSTV